MTLAVAHSHPIAWALPALPALPGLRLAARRRLRRYPAVRRAHWSILIRWLEESAVHQRSACSR